MMCSAHGSLGGEGSGAQKASRSDGVSKAVKQAQTEVERLLAALADGAELPDPVPINWETEDIWQPIANRPKEEPGVNPAV